MAGVTKAEALAVALDHAEETGEYPPELRRWVAQLVSALMVLPRWRFTFGRWRRGEVAEVYRHSGGWTARLHVHVGGPSDNQRRCAERSDAQYWCDHRLAHLGWMLEGRTPQSAPVNPTSPPSDTDGNRWEP